MEHLPSADAMNKITQTFGLLAGVGQFMGAREETKMGDYNAALFNQQAQAERESYRISEIQKRKLIKSKIGTQIAATASSGFRFSGDPITLLHASLANSEFDLMVDKYNSEIKARGFLSQADREKFEAKKRASKAYSEAGNSFLHVAADSYLSEIGGKADKLGTPSKPMKPSSVKYFNP